LRELDSSTELEVANSIWYRQGFPFRPTFIDAARSAFDAEVRALDFGNPTVTLATVNGWVDTKTRHKIPAILDQVDPSDVMYLLNAIYFKGSWRLRFDPAETRSGTFHPVSGGDQTVQLMHKEDTLHYSETSELQAVDLLYGNGAFAMTVLLPKPSTNIDAFAGSLRRADFSTLTEGFGTRKIILFLPKFTASYERTLNDDLTALGMGVAFDPARADFSRMAPVSTSANLYISLVKQKAFVDVNEEGTEAAAATAVGVSVTSAPVIPTMRVDRPFVFVIRERLSGTVLFMGKITRIPS
jgi:serine protease inhibitor